MSDVLDRTLELPAEPVDDLEPLESTSAGEAQRRPERIQTVSRPAPLDPISVTSVEDPRAAQVLAARQMAIARREQDHRHAMQREEQRQRLEHRRFRRKQEGRIMVASLVLVVASGIAWMLMPDTTAAQIVFTTSFGALVGYLGGRSRKGGDTL